MAIPFSDSSPPEESDHLDAISALQHGLFTRDQALREYTPRQIQVRLQRGDWVQVQPRVYRNSLTPLTRLAVLLAPILSAGPGSYLSYGAAGRHLGLRCFANHDPVEVSAIGTSLPRWDGVVGHRTRRLDRTDLRVIDGVACSSGARTLIDLAAVLDRAELLAAVDDAVAAGAVTRANLYGRSLKLRPGRPHVDWLIAIAGPGGELAFRSWLERVFNAGAEEAGLPTRLSNEPIRDTRGLVGLADFLFPDGPLIVELDGLRFHSTPAQRQRDQKRQNRMVLAGFPVLRFTYRDVAWDPERVYAEIAEALQTLGLSTSLPQRL